MAKQFACQDAGMDRPGKFTVETESELMQHVQVHAKSAHPDLQVTAELPREIKSLTKTVQARIRPSYDQGVFGFACFSPSTMMSTFSL